MRCYTNPRLPHLTLHCNAPMIYSVIDGEQTIHLAADTIRSDPMQKNIGQYNTDTICLLNCLLC